MTGNPPSSYVSGITGITNTGWSTLRILGVPRLHGATGLILLAGVVIGAALVLAGLYLAGALSQAADRAAMNAPTDDAASSEEPTKITFEPSKWKAAGIRIIATLVRVAAESS